MRAMASFQSMKQAIIEANLSAEKTDKHEFLEQMERVVPWAELVAFIAPYDPEGRTGRPPGALETIAAHAFPAAIGAACRTRRWRKPSLTLCYPASLHRSMPMGACLRRAPFCGFATG